MVLPILNVGPRPKKVLIISMNKKELLTKLKDIEGLSKDEKAYLTNLINTKKKYGLVWEDKPETVEEELRHKLPILKEVRERAIINDSESEKNLITFLLKATTCTPLQRSPLPTKTKLT